MSEFQRWSSQHRTIRAARDWNALLDHGLEKPASYIIRKNGNYVEAINGSTGKIDYGGQNNTGGVSGSDAAAVIQAAVDALTNGGKIVLREGLYTIDAYITLYDDVVLEGQGWQTIIKQADSANLDRMIRMRSVDNAGDRCVIRNLKLDGNKANQASGNGYLIDISGDVADTIIENLYLVDAKGSAINAYSGSVRLLIKNNYIVSPDVDGIAFNQNHSYFLIGGNRIENAGQHGIHIYDNSAGGNPNYEGVIEKNIILNPNNDGIFVTSSNGRNYNIVVSNNVCDGMVVNDGILLINCDYSSIVGNTIRGLGASGAGDGIVLDRTNYTAVIGNSITDAPSSGIYVKDSSHNAILGNVIENSGDASVIAGIWITAPDTGVCIHNIIVGNRVTGSSAQAIAEDTTVGQKPDYTLIFSNDLSGNAISNIQIAGSNTIIGRNIGFITENGGSAIIPANTKSYQVSFEMARTPTVVKVTPQFDVSGRWWISNLTWASGTSILSGAFTFNRTYSGLYSGIIHWNAEYIP